MFCSYEWLSWLNHISTLINFLTVTELTYEGLSEDFREPPCALSKSELWKFWLSLEELKDWEVPADDMGTNLIKLTQNHFSIFTQC